MARLRLAIAAVLLLVSPNAFAADFSETSITLAVPPGALAGTLALPSTGAPTAAVLLIAGSGPTNRDGNSTIPGVQPNTLKLLAQELAARGFATLRTDKRGIGESAAAMTSEADLTIQTYSGDNRAWATDLRHKAGVPCVWLLGHSEGALIAELAAKDNPDICGLILIAGAGRSMGTIIRAQVEGNPANPPEIRKQVFDILASLEAGHTVVDVPPMLQSLFRPSVQPYLMSELALDPAAILSRLRIPVQILQGDNDLQVSIADAQALAAARPDAKLAILAGVNHVLKIAPPDRAANFATYADPALPVAPGIVDLIASFMGLHRP